MRPGIVHVDRVRASHEMRLASEPVAALPKLDAAARSAAGAAAVPPVDVHWLRALALMERIGCARPGGNPVDASLEKGRWCEIPGLGDSESFRNRLAAEGISEQQFDAAVALTPEALHERCIELPEWLTTFLEAYSPEAPAAAPVSVPAAGLASLLSLVEPLVSRARARVRDGAGCLAARFPAVPFDANTVEPMLYARLAGRLTQLVSLPAILEMHVARLEGRLHGDTPEERFSGFACSLGVPDIARRLFAEYPVLARLVVQALEQWVTTSLEFLEHLSRERADLERTFNDGASAGLLLRLDSAAGDAHRRGRCVSLLQFSSGLRLAYKPRSLAVDRHFMELLTWLNERGGDLPAFRILRVLDCTDHGWVEFVEHRSCRTEQEVERFYRRQGMNLALLYALGARDFHYENLIAAGEHPVLIDLESLLAPHEPGDLYRDALDCAVADIARSVLSIGLLPYRAWMGKTSDGIDLSGLGSILGQTTPIRVSVWEDAGTDIARRERKHVSLQESNNRPMLGGRKVSVSEHADAVAEGFAGMYRLLDRLRGDLLAAGGPLTALADDEVRVILRPTAAYGVLLAEGCHPDVLRDALARDRLFDRLWPLVEQRPELARVFAAERLDLWHGDIPYFTTRPASRHLWNSRGESVFDFFPASGMELLHRRLGRFGPEDLARQSWYIKASLSSLDGRDHRTAGVRNRSVQAVVADAATRESLHAAARVIGDRLASLALRQGDEAAWNGLQLAGARHPVIAPLALDLYDGLPGVTLFLAHLGAITGEDRFTELAMAGLTTQLRLLERSGIPLAPIGAFTGFGGLIYELARLAVLWDRPDLRQRAEALAEALAPLIEQDEQLDVLGGAAGCLACLLALYRRFPLEQTLTAARRCGDHLLRTARDAEPGVAWLVPGMGERPLAGFSHGAAGIAWALLGLWDVTGDERYRRVACGAIDYERTLFCADADNWADLRPREPDEDVASSAFMTAWCHGAAGIGLARVGRLQLLDDACVRGEIEAAIRTTVLHAGTSNHCLCHGEMGNLELLVQARIALGDVRLEEPLTRRTAEALGAIKRTGWVCGLPKATETPGLMTGLAGIGYGLLRLAERERVPSVLLLES
jgi:type 2 lantibiotic biosynthesis protein LanM